MTEPGTASQAPQDAPVPQPTPTESPPRYSTRRRITGAVCLAILIGCVIYVGSAVFGASNHAAPATNHAPAICLTALDDAERVVGLAHDALGYAGDAMSAAGRLDTDGIDEQTANMQALEPKVTDAVNAYNSAATLCRAS